MAIKRVPAGLVDATREIELHRKLKSPYIVSFIGCTEYQESELAWVYIITEYMAHGTLGNKN